MGEYIDHCTEMVTTDEVAVAFNIWQMANTDKPFSQLADQFSEMCGISCLSLYAAKRWVTPAQAARIRTIAGPHGYTYCKALVARGGQCRE